MRSKHGWECEKQKRRKLAHTRLTNLRQTTRMSHINDRSSEDALGERKKVMAG